MDWGFLADIVGSSAALGWLGLAGGTVAWIAKDRAARKVRVGAATWSSSKIHQTKDGEQWFVPTATVVLFNNLAVDVGLHSVVIDFRQGRKISYDVIPAISQGLPKTIATQHSVTIHVKAEALLASQIFIGLADAGEAVWMYRLRIRLGNGVFVRTKWAPLSEVRRASTHDGGVDPDF